MKTEVTKEQIDEVLKQCQENINNDNAEYFRSYEEGNNMIVHMFDIMSFRYNAYKEGTEYLAN